RRTASCAGAATVAALRNGLTIRHERRKVVGTVTRLYTSADDKSYVDVPTDEIEHFERDETPAPTPAPAPAQVVQPAPVMATTPALAPAPVRNAAAPAPPASAAKTTPMLN